jgi:hypothetical protein
VQSRTNLRAGQIVNKLRLKVRVTL